MATLTVQDATAAGVALTFNAATAGGDEVPNADGRTVLLLRNAHATLPRTITIATPQTVGGLAVADRTVTVAAVTTAVVSDLIPSTYNNTATGRLALTYSDSGADISVACFRP